MNQGAQQASQCQPGQCKSCERTGIPVLPLRYAPTPAIGAKFNRGIDAEYHDNNLRILRKGYVYVLLDKKIWQAYQVTPEGALRQFDPLQPPRGDAKTLSQACITENHDVPASFINIGDGFATAQIAFANDAWPKQVLDDYRTGKSPATRFSTYTIAKFKTDPSTAGASKSDEAFGMTQTLDLTKKVWEYAPGAKDFDSVHGFYSRANRVAPTQAFVAASIKQYKLEKGIPVVLLHDAIGTVQEYNSLRNKSVEALNRYTSEPITAYKYFTSQALVGLKDQQAKWAAQQAPASVQAQVQQRTEWNSNPVLASKAGLPPVNVERETGRITAEMTKDAHARLEDRYREADRKAFQDQYDRTVNNFQKQIDRFGHDWAQWCEADRWVKSCDHDYHGDAPNWDSGCAYTGMMALCVAGGPSERPEPKDPKNPEKDPPLKGATRILWGKWLNDKSSPVYKALMAKNTNFLAGLAPSFDANGNGQLNDFSKIYEAFKSAQTSADVGTKFMQPALQQSVGVLVLAMNSAVTSLRPQLAKGVPRGVRHMNMAVAKLYLKRTVTRFTVELTVTEYFRLLSDQLHEGSKQAGKRVRALILGGLIAFPSPAARNQLIKVTQWSFESAEAVKQRLLKTSAAGAQKVGDTYGRIVQGIETFEPNAIAAIKRIEVGGSRLYEFASLTQGALRGHAAGGEILLAFLSLYGQLDGLSSTLDTLKTTVGATYPETLMGAWSFSVGVFAAGAELAGKSVKVLSESAGTVATQAGKATAASVLNSSASVAKLVGEKSGIVGALFYFVDAAQDGLSAVRVARQGDDTAMIRYAYAGVLSGFAGIVGVIGASAPEATLLGPVGIAVVIGLVAYGFVQLAKQAESTLPDLWARRCYFGDHKGKLKPWKDPSDADEAIGTLNALLLGVSVDVEFRPCSLQTVDGVGALTDSVAVDFGYELRYRIVLPNFNAARSAYAFSLKVTRHTGATQVLLNRQQGTSTLPSASAAPPKGSRDYHLDSLEPAVFQKGDPEAITGAIRLNGPQEGGNDIVSAQVYVKYFPDRLDEYGFAELTVQESF